MAMSDLVEFRIFVLNFCVYVRRLISLLFFYRNCTCSKSFSFNILFLAFGPSVCVRTV